jgi:hypothetical protein
MHCRPQAARLGAVMLSLLCLLVLAPPLVSGARARSADQPRFRPARIVTPDAAVLARTAPEAVKAGTTDQQCTGWRSTLTPPPSIRVLRTAGPAAVVGMAQEVPFREYVGTVIRAEWPSSYPIETLKAGAVAVKQYGWYYTIVFRGGKDAQGNCYDVVDTTADQLYRPEELTPRLSHRTAIHATWNLSLRKFRQRSGASRMMLTGYRAGEDVACGANADRWHMFQRSMRRCGLDGLTMEQMLRIYLAPNLEIVDPGRHDIIGREFGDASALVGDGDGRLTAHVWPTREESTAPSEVVGPALHAQAMVGQASADLTGDGRDDLLVAHLTPKGRAELTVVTSNGTGYREPAVWYTGSLGPPGPASRLLVGDFTGSPPAGADGRIDAALLVQGGEPATSRLLVFARTRGGPGFEPPVVWWEGALDLERATAWAMDANGDGRSDLLVREPVGGDGTGGIRYSTALSARQGGALGPLRERYLAADLRAGAVHQVIGDANRDGRDDVWLVIGGPQRGRVDLLRSTTGNRPFTRLGRVWVSKQRMPASRLRVAAADIDFNGFGDLVLYQDMEQEGATSGVRRITLRAGYGSLTQDDMVEDASLDWSRTRPF